MRFTLFQKGHLIKNGMVGIKVNPQKSRDEYVTLSYKTAKKTARRIDKALQAVSLFNSD